MLCQELCDFIHFIYAIAFNHESNSGIVTIPILQIRKLKLIEINKVILAESHTVYKWEI